jgi:hypothetical protein
MEIKYYSVLNIHIMMTFQGRRKMMISENFSSETCVLPNNISDEDEGINLHLKKC